MSHYTLTRKQKLIINITVRNANPNPVSNIYGCFFFSEVHDIWDNFYFCHDRLRISFTLQTVKTVIISYHPFAHFYNRTYGWRL